MLSVLGNRSYVPHDMSTKMRVLIKTSSACVEKIPGHVIFVLDVSDCMEKTILDKIGRCMQVITDSLTIIGFCGSGIKSQDFDNPRNSKQLIKSALCEMCGPGKGEGDLVAAINEACNKAVAVVCAGYPKVVPVTIVLVAHGGSIRENASAVDIVAQTSVAVGVNIYAFGTGNLPVSRFMTSVVAAAAGGEYKYVGPSDIEPFNNLVQVLNNQSGRCAKLKLFAFPGTRILKVESGTLQRVKIKEKQFACMLGRYNDYTEKTIIVTLSVRDLDEHEFMALNGLPQNLLRVSFNIGDTITQDLSVLRCGFLDTINNWLFDKLDSENTLYNTLQRFIFLAEENPVKALLYATETGKIPGNCKSLQYACNVLHSEKTNKLEILWEIANNCKER